jgi:hypothetical protein
MTRKRPARLVDPQSAHYNETLRILGVPTGKDRSIADQRARLAEPGSDKPKAVSGNIDDGTVFNDLLNVLEARNIITNKAVRGGAFGVEHRNAMLVNADSPLLLFVTQSASDTASTTNTATTVVAAATALTLGPGKWAVTVLVGMILAHSTSSTVGISAEIEGNEGTVRTVTNATATSGVRCEANISLTAEVNWLQGEQTLNLRARFRSSTAGTTSARNPSIIGYAKRMD